LDEVLEGPDMMFSSIIPSTTMSVATKASLVVALSPHHYQTRKNVGKKWKKRRRRRCWNFLFQ